MKIIKKIWSKIKWLFKRFIFDYDKFKSGLNFVQNLVLKKVNKLENVNTDELINCIFKNTIEKFQFIAPLAKIIKKVLKERLSAFKKEIIENKEINKRIETIFSQIEDFVVYKFNMKLIEK